MPVYVLSPVRMTVPNVCVTVPLPEIALSIVVVPVRENTSAALFTTASVPSVPTDTSSIVPSTIVVPPLYVLSAVRRSVPSPVFVSPTVPPISHLMVLVPLAVDTWPPSPVRPMLAPLRV